MADDHFPSSSSSYLELDDLGLPENSSHHLASKFLGANVATTHHTNLISDTLVSNMSLGSSNEPISYHQQPYDIWKNFLPSAAALISNSATAVVSAAASVSQPLFTTAKSPDQLYHHPDESIHETGSSRSNSLGSSSLPVFPSIAANSIFMEQIPNSSTASRLSSTLSVNSGNPSSVLLNSISAVATSTGGYWDSLANSTLGDTTSPAVNLDGVTDLDYEFDPEDELRVSLGLAIVFCVLYGLVFIVGVIGNSFVVAVVFRSPRMRTPTNFFIANLAVADLLVVLFCLPATLIANIYSAWILGQWMCKFVSYLQGVSVSASIDTLIAIAIERYLAICHPMKCQISSRVCRIMILVIWTFSFSITLPWAIYFQLTPLNPNIPDNDLMVCTEKWPDAKLGNIYFAVAHVVFCYLLPLILITICYTLILRKVSMRKIPQETKNLSTELLVQRSKMKVIKMLLLVVVLFAMSWLPLYAIYTRVKFGPPPSEWEDQLIRTIIPMAQCLGSSNSCINPILYAFFNKKYRTGFKAVLLSRSCCSTLRVEVSTSSKTDSSTRSSNRINLSTQIKNGSAALLSSSGSDRHHNPTERTTSLR